MWMSVLLAAVVIGIAQAAAVALVSATRPGRNIYAIVIGVVLVMAPLVFFAGDAIVRTPLTTGGRVGVVLLHCAIGGFLFHFMTLPDRSVTLRILVELWRAPNGALSIEALDARYGVRGMIESRLRQLQDGDCLVMAPDGALVLTPRGERFGRIVAAGRRLFRIESAN